MNEQTMRAEFESYAKRYGALYTFSDTGNYIHSGIQAAWESWQHRQKEIDDLLHLYIGQNVAVEAALRRVFSLGQTYWQQADSEYISHNKKSKDTFEEFEKLIGVVRDNLAHAKGVKT